MFETSQQEQGSDTTKIIGIVVVVVVVLMVGVYFMFLREEPAATMEAGAGAAEPSAAAMEEGLEPDPMRDLTIVRFNLGRDQTQTMAMWDLQLSNRSRAYGYRNIQYATNYYDAADNLVYHNEGTFDVELGPGDQRTIQQLNDGLYPVDTARYTIEITDAEFFRPGQ